MDTALDQWKTISMFTFDIMFQYLGWPLQQAVIITHTTV
jgi:hypothetical protein